jgi:hypothetical protein
MRVKVRISSSFYCLIVSLTAYRVWGTGEWGRSVRMSERDKVKMEVSSCKKL